MEDIRDILSTYRNINEHSDLFEFWEGELRLRRQARAIAITPEQSAVDARELDFLLRSLYLAGRQEAFFNILINSLNTQPVLHWLQNAPGALQETFLQYLPWYIGSYSGETRKLQFLVSIYQDSYQAAYQAIVNVLNLELCSYLLSRTANPELRAMLKKREEMLLNEKNQARYGIRLDPGKSLTYATIYGDKVKLLGDTYELMQSTDSRNFSDPYGAKRFELLLQAGEMLFECGLIEDGLLNLIDTYEDYQENNRLVESLEDEKIYRQFFRILRRLVPCYALLVKPNAAWTEAVNIYRQFFARVEADLPSLQYLNIYESIAAGQQLDLQHIVLEIFYKSEKIRDFRSSEPPLLAAGDIDSGFKNERLSQLRQLFQEKLAILPHEAFVIMELLRLLQFKGYLELGPKPVQAMLKAYMELWKWVPHRLFMNRSIIEQLAPRLDDPSRLEAERLLTSLENYDNEKISSDLLNRPELFRKRSENIRREIFLGKFLGWL